MSVGYIIEKELVQIVNSIPGHDPTTQQLQLNGKQFAFEVDSSANDNCSTQVWTKFRRRTLQPVQICYVSATGAQLAVLGAFKAKASLDSPTRVSEITLYISSLPHLNFLGQTAIHLSGIDVHVVLQPGGNTCKNDVHAILEESQPNLAQ